jgi:hypothetical protein
MERRRSMAAHATGRIRVLLERAGVRIDVTRRAGSIERYGDLRSA